MNKFKSIVLLSFLYVGGQVGFSSTDFSLQISGSSVSETQAFQEIVLQQPVAESESAVAALERFGCRLVRARYNDYFTFGEEYLWEYIKKLNDAAMISGDRTVIEKFMKDLEPKMQAAADEVQRNEGYFEWERYHVALCDSINSNEYSKRYATDLLTGLKDKIAYLNALSLFIKDPMQQDGMMAKIKAVEENLKKIILFKTEIFDFCKEELAGIEKELAVLDMCQIEELALANWNFDISNVNALREITYKETSLSKENLNNFVQAEGSTFLKKLKGFAELIEVLGYSQKNIRCLCVKDQIHKYFGYCARKNIFFRDKAFDMTEIIKYVGGKAKHSEIVEIVESAAAIEKRLGDMKYVELVNLGHYYELAPIEQSEEELEELIAQLASLLPLEVNKVLSDRLTRVKNNYEGLFSQVEDFYVED